MRVFFPVILLFSQISFGADKVYPIKKAAPEIAIGKTEKADEAKKERWNAAIIRSSLSYHLPSVTTHSPTFSPELVGIFVGKKTDDQLFGHNGFWEIGVEWQRFKRESNLGGNFSYSQNLNLYQLNFYQNFFMGSVFRDQVIFSAGAGAAPVYLTSEQSVFGDSSSEIGFMVMLKGNITYPVFKSYELDFSFRGGLGSDGNEKIEMASILLGLNFD